MRGLETIIEMNMTAREYQEHRRNRKTQMQQAQGFRKANALMIAAAGIFAFVAGFNFFCI